jgi:hypothetical protein
LQLRPNVRQASLQRRVTFSATSALPISLAAGNRSDYVALAQAYKQINSAVGQLGLKTLQASTFAITSNDAGDTTYSSCEAQINNWVTTRNNLAQQMNQVLQGAEFGGVPVDHTTAQNLISQANTLIAGATPTFVHIQTWEID